MTKITVNKLEAAQRQIDAAIRMLFSCEDPVAIHALAMASLQILKDVVADRAKQDPSVLLWDIDSKIKPGKQKEFWCGIKKFSNFLKHADRAPNESYDNFEAALNDEKLNDWVLFFASKNYCKLCLRGTPEMDTLQAWLTMIHPDVFLQGESENCQLSNLVEAAGAIQTLPRKEQLELGLEMLRRWRVRSCTTSGSRPLAGGF